MQSYGSCELTADMTKITIESKTVEIFAQLNLLLSEEVDDYFITPSEYVQGDYDNNELKEATKNLINEVWKTLKIDIYPTYIDGEAEGTDNAGELIWCIEPELIPTVKKYSNQWVTWSTFG